MTKSEAVLLTAFRALRNTLASAVDQIDVILDMAEKPVEDSPQSDRCPHPASKRMAQAAMGHPNRFLCTVCNETVEE